jgi:hypothetical protein
MGLKHPISTKLKKYNMWNIILYKFNSLSNSIDKNKKLQNIIINLIYHYFQNLIISKPILNFGNNILKIKIFYYIKLNKKSLNNNFQSGLYNNIIKLENLFEKFFKIPVKFQLIKINNPILNANILAQLIAKNLKYHSISKI